MCCWSCEGGGVVRRQTGTLANKCVERSLREQERASRGKKRESVRQKILLHAFACYKKLRIYFKNVMMNAVALCSALHSRRGFAYLFDG